VHRLRAPERLGSRLAEADVEDLPLLHQLCHRADRLLDRRLRVDPVLVVEVDVVGAKALERPLDRALHVLGGAVRGPDRGHIARLRVVHPVVELGGDHAVVPTSLDRPADEHLVGERPVDLGGIEEIDPELERPLDRRDRLVFVGCAVGDGHAHTAKSEFGDGE
jgi:hypothetical protein